MWGFALEGRRGLLRGIRSIEAWEGEDARLGPSWSHVYKIPKQRLKTDAKLECEAVSDVEGAVDMMAWRRE